MQQKDMNSMIIFIILTLLVTTAALVSGSTHAGGLGRMSVPSDWSFFRLKAEG